MEYQVGDFSVLIQNVRKTLTPLERAFKGDTNAKMDWFRVLHTLELSYEYVLFLVRSYTPFIRGGDYFIWILLFILRLFVWLPKQDALSLVLNFWESNNMDLND